MVRYDVTDGTFSLVEKGDYVRLDAEEYGDDAMKCQRSLPCASVLPKERRVQPDEPVIKHTAGAAACAGRCRQRSKAAELVASIRRARVKARAVWVRIAAQKGCKGKALDFVNVAPRWDESNKRFMLNFQGRAKCASVKNVQLVEDTAVTNLQSTFDNVAFSIGKFDENHFNVDFRSPFSFLHAFALSLIIVDSSAYLGCM